ncbi:MAG: hypothetical protein B7Y40_02240 [Gammaproteobacteria bacterium 28-57-27]|nr:MAG: hypothetical protein B7Y40_02240 [Gammaproteobacteria bacterium 28-57-27]
MFQHMLKLIFLIILSLAASGCATGPDVWVDYNPSTPFGQYKTFSFAHPLGTDSDGYQSILSQRLVAATQRELEARGMRRVDGMAQLRVDFRVMWVERSQVTPYFTPMIGYGFGRGYYGRGSGFYGSGFYGAWPLYPTQGVVSTYVEGTLRIDITDEARRQRVWVGLISDFATDIGSDLAPSGVEAAVAAAFAKYPLPVRGLAR